MRASVVLLGPVLLSGCLALAPEARRVIVTKEDTAVAGCAILGVVEAHPPYLTSDDGMNQLKNKTAGLGGNTLYVTSYAMTATGMAYRCGHSTAEQAEMHQQSAMNAMVVTPGDMSGRKYAVVGSVDYPGRGVTMISPTASCSPDDARRAALERYGQVDAIIGFTQWRDGDTPHCGGTAVRFTE